MPEGTNRMTLVCQGPAVRQINSKLNPFLTKGIDDNASFKAFEFPTCHPLDRDSSQLECLESGEESQTGTGVIVRELEFGGFKCLEIVKKWKNGDRLRNTFTINDQCCQRTQNKAPRWLEKMANGTGAEQAQIRKNYCSLGNMIQ